MNRLAGSALLFIILISAPVASAHGPGTYWVILRDTSIQPAEAELLQNDTILFMATGSDNLTLRTMDIQGRLIECEMAKNDSCTISLDYLNWSSGIHLFEFFDTNDLRHSFNLTVLPDTHNVTSDNTTVVTAEETVISSQPLNDVRSTPWPTMMASMILLLVAFIMGRRQGMDRWNEA